MRPADLLPLESKAQLVVSAAPDLVEAEKGLREIDILDKRGVAGAGDLERESTTLACCSRVWHDPLEEGDIAQITGRRVCSCNGTW